MNEMRKAFEKTVQCTGAHSKQQVQERYFLFGIGYNSRDEEVRELQEQIGYLKGDIININGIRKSMQCCENCDNVKFPATKIPCDNCTRNEFSESKLSDNWIIHK